MDGIRKIYGFQAVDSFVIGMDHEGLTSHSCLYSDSADAGAGLIVPMFCEYIIDAGETPVVFIPQSPNGSVTGSIYSFAAIPEGAANKLNAYRFFKVLL